VVPTPSTGTIQQPGEKGEILGQAIARLSFIPWNRNHSGSCIQLIMKLEAYGATFLTPRNLNKNGFDRDELREPDCFFWALDAVRDVAKFSDLPADTVSLIQTVVEALQVMIPAEPTPPSSTDEEEDIILVFILFYFIKCLFILILV
jgi:hypothetical protein